MAKQIPLTTKLQGKVGGLIFAKNGSVRVSNPGANRTPTEFKRIFAMLAQAWPYSSIEFKNLVENSPGTYNGVSVITGATAGVHRFLLDNGAAANTGVQLVKGLLPDRLENLPGEFGEDIIRPVITEVSIENEEDNGQMTPVIGAVFNDVITSDYENHRAAAFQFMRDNVSEGTDVPVVLQGIKLYTPTLASNVLSVDLLQVAVADLPCVAIITMWATHKASGVRMTVANVIAQLAS